MAAPLACSSWNEPAPEKWRPKPCSSLADRLVELRAHVADDGFKETSAWLTSPQTGADIKHVVALLPATNTNLAKLNASGPGDAGSGDTQPGNGEVGQDASAVMKWARSTLDVLLLPPSKQPAANEVLAELSKMSHCLDETAWRLLGTLFRDPRTATALASLMKASLRQTSQKQTELAEVGLDDPIVFQQLVGTLLKSLADPEFAPGPLLELLSGLASTPDGLLTALGNTLSLLVTEPSGLVAPKRRAHTAALLTCLGARETQTLLPWLIHGVLVRQPGLVTSAPTPTPGDSPSLLPAAKLADAFASQKGGRAALIRLVSGVLQPAVVAELRAMLQPPLSTELQSLIAGLPAAATCATR
ncbi:MAG: hypothetical protein KC502_09115 [Myxococcales bacterium]|nr:hypothetical protein [Myxococcales bacterium]